jgi:hypothetical protein
MVARYEIDGKRYLQVVNFNKHQNPHRDEKVSTLPDIDGNVAATEPAPKKHGANTVQAPCVDGSTTGSVGLTPDPLIPESLNLDSLTELPPAKSDGPSAGGQDEFDDWRQGGAPAANAGFTPTEPARMMMAMKAKGISDGQPSNPTFVELVKAGASVEEFEAAAESAVKGQKGFAYAVGIVVGERKRAALLAKDMPQGPLPANRSTAANSHKYAGAAAAIFDDESDQRSYIDA